MKNYHLVIDKWNGEEFIYSGAIINITHLEGIKLSSLITAHDSIYSCSLEAVDCGCGENNLCKKHWLDAMSHN